jgi:hypothetical protein
VSPACPENAGEVTRAANNVPVSDGGCVERLAYEASLRALEDQERELEQLRTRTGTLLATGAVAASFLAAAALDRGGGDLLGGLALIAFLALSLTSLYVMVPKANLVFAISGSVLYESLSAVADDEAEIHRRLAYWLEEYWEDNDKKIDLVTRWSTAASWSLALEVVLGVLALRSTI